MEEAVGEAGGGEELGLAMGHAGLTGREGDQPGIEPEAIDVAQPEEAVARLARGREQRKGEPGELRIRRMDEGVGAVVENGNAAQERRKRGLARGGVAFEYPVGGRRQPGGGNGRFLVRIGQARESGSFLVEADAAGDLE